MKDVEFILLKKLLIKLKLRIDFNELKLQLLSHPSYPSLYSLTNVLNHFGISNIALEVPVSMETLTHLPRYFISKTSEEGGLVLVTKKRNTIELFSRGKLKTSVSFTDFLSIWSGLVMAIDEENALVNNKNLSAAPLWQLGYLISGIILMCVFFLSRPSLFQSTHYLLSVTGLGMSFLIVRHELGFHSRIIDQLCSTNKFTSCDAVLYSKTSVFSKYLKASDISMIYFTSLIICWVVSLALLGYNFVLVWGSLLTLPITFYSIYYQKNIVKKWCPLCLGVVGVLWLQAGSLWLIRDSLKPAELGLNEVSMVLLSFWIAVTFWTFVRPLLENRQELKKLKLTHLKFKRNYALFHAALNTAEIKDMKIEGLSGKEIIKGNEYAGLHIVIVTNPLCIYCKEAHTDLEAILDRWGQELSVTIRFNINVTDKQKPVYRVSSTLLELYHTRSESEFYKALDEAFSEETDLNNWLLIWEKRIERDFNCDAVLESQHNWCKSQDINFTPVLFINGRLFPKPFNRRDLVMYVEDMLEDNSLVHIENHQLLKLD